MRIHMMSVCSCGSIKDKRSVQCRSCRDDRDRFKGETRICTSCEETKPISEFRIRTRKTPRPRSNCRQCEAINQRKRYDSLPIEKRHIATRRWEKNNPDKLQAQILRDRIRVLGLADKMQEIINLFNSQRECEICKHIPSDKSKRYKTLTIDHDHKTTKFRGLICAECNLGLGKFKDNPDLLIKAAKYLTKGT